MDKNVRIKERISRENTIWFFSTTWAKHQFHNTTKSSRPAAAFPSVESNPGITCLHASYTLTPSPQSPPPPSPPPPPSRDGLLAANIGPLYVHTVWSVSAGDARAPISHPITSSSNACLMSLADQRYCISKLIPCLRRRFALDKWEFLCDITTSPSDRLLKDAGGTQEGPWTDW